MINNAFKIHFNGIWIMIMTAPIAMINELHSSKYQLIEVETSALMRAWQASWQALAFHEKGVDLLGESCPETKDRRDFYRSKIQDGAFMAKPRLFISARGEPEIADGRLRLAALWMEKAEKIQILVPKRDVPEFLERFAPRPAAPAHE